MEQEAVEQEAVEQEAVEGDAPADEVKEGEGEADAAVGAWDPSDELACAQCGLAAPCPRSPVGTSSRPDTRRSAPRPHAEGQWRLVAQRPLREGDLLKTLYAEEGKAAWVCPGRSWFPRPRTGGRGANSTWHITCCRTCRVWRACLCTNAPVEAGTEVTVGADAHVSGPRDEDHTFEVTFDGGAKAMDALGGARVAGAGAILWGPPGRQRGPSASCTDKGRPSR